MSNLLRTILENKTALHIRGQTFSHYFGVISSVCQREMVMTKGHQLGTANDSAFQI